MKNMTVFTRYSTQGASSRYRYFLYVNKLYQHDINLEVDSFFDIEYLQNLYYGRKRNLHRIFFSYLKRLMSVLNSADHLLIEYELFPFIPYFIEKLFLRKRKYLLNFDDYVWINYTDKWLLRKKFDKLVKNAAGVIVANDYLFDKIRGLNPRIVKIPTVVDLDLYRQISGKYDKFSLVWIGTPVTYKYIQAFSEMLQKLAEEIDYELIVISTSSLEDQRIPGVNMRFVEWSSSTEAEYLAKAHVGIMPLFQDEFSSGKSAFKIIQYLASGLPVVASNIGENCKVVEENENGFLASNTAEWIEAIKNLKGNPGLYSRIAANSRKSATNYSIDKYFPVFERFLETCLYQDTRPRIKVAFFIIELFSGGAEWQLARLAASLPARGFDVEVICMHGKGDVAAWLEERGIVVHCLNFSKPWKIWKLWVLIGILRKFKPDIFHTWMFHANFVGKIIGTICGVPKIIASLRVAEKERRYHLVLERLTSFLNCRILCNSLSLCEFIKEHKLNKKKLKVIPNSFDNALFSFRERKSPGPGEPWRILFLGRKSTQKGMPYLMGAAGKLKEKGVDFMLDMVGEADPGFDEFLEKEIAEKGLEKIVTMKKSIPHDEIPILMDDYHLLVLPSLWEGMPNVILEAFASGLPAIATNIEGSSDLIEHRKRGLLAEPKDSGDLFKQIDYAFSNYPEMIEMSKRADKFIKENFLPDIIHEHYTKLYKNELKDIH